MGIANIINNSTTTSGGEIVRELVNSSDGAGLNLANNGYIDIANNAATEFSTSDFTIEFVLNQTSENVSDNYYYFTHTGGNSRMRMWHDISDNNITVGFINSSGTFTDFDLDYDMSADYGTPTHYVFAFDRSADLTLYKNGNSVASVNISSVSSINIGAGNANVSRISSTTGYGVLGTFYRFRAFNTLADAKLLFERADVPQTLTANLLYDLDLAFANPTQSLTVQDRKGNSDGTASSNTLVTQVQPVVQLNSTSARIGTTAATPADGEVVANVVKSVDGSDYIKIDADTGQVAMYRTGNYIDFLKSGSTFKIRGPGYTDFLIIDSTGQSTFTRDGGLAITSNRTTDDGDAIHVRKDNYTRLRLGTLGITFPNGAGAAPTAAANNQLDYYGEGTFIPTLTKGSTSVTSPNTATGRYVRVGNQLFVTFYFYKTGAPTTSGTNNWTIGGLPFACVTGAPYGSINAGYVYIQSTSYQFTSPYRWQTGSVGTELLLYGTQGQTNNTGGTVEFSGFGVLEIA